MIRFLSVLTSITIALLSGLSFPAQSDADLVARVKVDSAGVEVRRVNTAAWIPIKIESLVGAGDSIRTMDKGTATLTFFDGVMDAQLTPESEIQLKTFSGSPDASTVEVDAVRGFTTYITRRTLKDNTHYRIHLPTFDLSLADGQVRVRIEANGRSAALNTSTGKTNITWTDGGVGLLTQNNGARVAQGEPPSEIVQAVSFETLDSALDGCPSRIVLAGDVQLNVRTGAALNADRIGGVDPNQTVQAMGVTARGGWYRIRFKDGFGWVSIEKMPLEPSCAGLRRFPDGYQEGGANPPPTSTPASAS